ncbi:MAG: CBS domain-containing protein [Actinomycetota bacterium]|nr:CBS domain-containing protein [Actinomycetota bacterium]
MRISELMRTPAVTCRTTTSLGEVARVMRDREVGCVLVLDETDYLAGVVTDRDLALRGLGVGRTADTLVRDVMSRDVVSVSVRADVSEAAALMAKRSVRRLPVVDEHDHPRGVITLDDLVRDLGAEADLLVDTIVLQSSRRSW